MRLGSGTQAIAATGTTLVLAWTIVATAILLMDNIGAGNLRDQAQRDRATYEQRLNELARARDARAIEARTARTRFDTALQRISVMQEELLASEIRRRELETGLEVVQGTLRRSIAERDAARAETRRLAEAVAGKAPDVTTEASKPDDPTVSYLTAALRDTAEERDLIEDGAQSAMRQADEMARTIRLMQEENDAIFRRLEDALTISVEPLTRMFRAAGLDPEQLLDAVRRGYSGIGGPGMPLSVSTRGSAAPASVDRQRTQGLLRQLDRLNLYRLAAAKAPFTTPLPQGFRLTSPYGPRWGRMHEGVDIADRYGAPVQATADGVVTYAGWLSGYGRLIKIRHEFGIETRYAHLAKIRVKKGQRVSRGERIGDMGNSGRSTGPHLHYEVRTGDKPVNPMTYIKAARDVF